MSNYDGWKTASPHDRTSAVQAQRAAERHADNLDAAEAELTRLLARISTDPLPAGMRAIPGVVEVEGRDLRGSADLTIAGIDCDIPAWASALELSRAYEHLAQRAREYAALLQQRGAR